MTRSPWYRFRQPRTIFAMSNRPPVTSPTGPRFRPRLECLEERNLLSVNYSATILADSPAGYWRLGEKSGTVAADLSGNNLPGTYTGGAALGRPGALTDDLNSAAGFNGTSTYVDMGSPGKL